MESRTDYRRRRITTRALTARVAALAGAAALALGAGISWQMARGADPALGPKAQSAGPPQQVVRTVVVRRVPAPALSAGASSSTSPSSGSVATTPAPSPAPVTTSAS